VVDGEKVEWGSTLLNHSSLMVFFHMRGGSGKSTLKAGGQTCGEWASFKG